MNPPIRIRLTAACLTLLLGCGSPYEHAIRDADGNTVRLEGIQKVVQDETLTDEQKATILLDQGLSEDLVEFFLQVDLSTLNLPDNAA